MIDSPPASSSPAHTDSAKRLRLTIPRNNKLDLSNNSNPISPTKLNENSPPMQPKTLDCNNTMTAMKQQLSPSIDNENDTTLLTTTTTTTTVEVKVKTTKTSSASSRKRKLNVVDEAINTTSSSSSSTTDNNDDDVSKQAQSVNKKKVMYIKNTIEARKTKRKFNLFFSFARLGSPRDNDILMCACMRVRSPYLLSFLHT